MEHSTYPPAAAAHSRSGSLAGMENNFKKAITELLVLFLLNEREMYINEITAELSRRSGESFLSQGASGVLPAHVRRRG